MIYIALSLICLSVGATIGFVIRDWNAPTLPPLNREQRRRLARHYRRTRYPR